MVVLYNTVSEVVDIISSRSPELLIVPIGSYHRMKSGMAWVCRGLDGSLADALIEISPSKAYSLEVASE